MLVEEPPLDADDAPVPEGDVVTAPVPSGPVITLRFGTATQSESFVQLK